MQLFWYVKNINSYTHIHTSITHNNQKVEAISVFIYLSDEQTDKLWSTHTIAYLSALTRKEVLSHAATWKNLEDMTLSDMSQKDQCYRIPVI